MKRRGGKEKEGKGKGRGREGEERSTLFARRPRCVVGSFMIAV